MRYGDVEAVTGATIDLPAGHVAAIIGPNGSGKSTLLGTISGLVRPDSGRVLVHGRTPPRARRRLAHVLQSTIANQAVPLTVQETVRMGCYGRRRIFRPLTTADRAAVEQAIERMRIGDLRNRQLLELSGGQRQRAYVAQALAQRADVLLLDEPINGLDLVTQEAITNVIRSERDRGATVVLTTHDIGTAQLADTAVLMASAIVAAGPPTEVLTAEHLATAYGRHAQLLADGTVVLDAANHQRSRQEDHVGG